MKTKVTGKMLQEMMQNALLAEADQAEAPFVRDAEDIAPSTSGVLGDYKLEKYEVTKNKMPSFYRTVFENSGILQASGIEERTKKLQSFIDALSGDEEIAGSVESGIADVFVTDMLESIVAEAWARSTSGLQHAGNIMESFVALLFSGTRVGQMGDFADVVIGDPNQLISVKFIAPTSTNYQALNTVAEHFENSAEPILFFNIVKSKISQSENSQLRIFLGSFTKEEWLEVKKWLKTREKGENKFKTESALVTMEGEKYRVQNPKSFGIKASSDPESAQDERVTVLNKGDRQRSTGPKAFTPSSYTGNRITFLKHGKLVSVLNFPAPNKMRKSKERYLQSLETKIVEITQSLKNLQAATLVFSTTSLEDEKKPASATKVGDEFTKSKNLLTAELGENYSDVISESEKVTATFLKNLIEENFKK